MSETATMAKKKMGRPKSARADVSIKFDKALADKARIVSLRRGISMAEYLSELNRAAIERDYEQEVRKMGGGK